MNLLQAKRMVKWADFLYELPPSKFDMGNWICNSGACAAGWLPNIFPHFFYLSRDDHRPLLKKSYMGHSTPTSSIDCVANFFGITMPEATNIIVPWMYSILDRRKKIKPKQVAKRIDRIVQSYGYEIY